MAPQVKTALEEHKRQNLSSLKGYVFTHKSGAPLDDHVDQIWAGALKKAGARHRKAYNLRHSFATDCIIKGLPLPYTAKIMGHTTIEQLIRNYTGWINSESEKQANAFKAAFGSTTSDHAGTKCGTPIPFETSKAKPVAGYGQ
jgi:integrase